MTPAPQCSAFVAITLGAPTGLRRTLAKRGGIFYRSRRISGWQTASRAGDYMRCLPSRHRRIDRVLWLRRLHVLGGLAGRVSDRVARGR